MKAARRSYQILFLPAICLFLLFSCSAFTAEDSLTGPLSAAQPQWKHDWVKGAVFYEIFVRSFCDSNGDGIGDLPGLTSKLDYLNDGKAETTSDLGIDGIWLMPVFQSPSYHGYDATDYYHINPDYGTDADFQTFLQAAHQRGIYVIVDLVINHTSSEHPWFLESQTSSTATKRDWYVWRSDNPGWTQPWGGGNPTWYPLNGSFYYGVFWSGMPDLNFRSKIVRKEIYRIAKYWLQKGVDGFRMDATRYLIETGPNPGQADTPETHAFLKRFSLKVRKTKPESILVGENWTETPIIASYFGSTAVVTGGDELPMNFNFPLSDRLIAGVLSGNATGISQKLQEINTVYPHGINDAPFLTNHDQVRLATQLKTNPSRLSQAASILLTLPGTPFLYYGEEVGIENGPAQGDEAKRTPMPWDDSRGGGFTTGTPWYAFAPGRNHANVKGQTSNSTSLLSHYRNLIRLRKSSLPLSKGDLQVLATTSGSYPALAFLRTAGTEKVVVLHNLTDGFTIAGPYPIDALRVEAVFVDGSIGPSGTRGQWSFAMSPRSSAVFRLQ